VVKRYFAKRLKKPLFFNLLAGGATFAILLSPLFVHAGTFSFISSLLGQTANVSSASASSYNSQTMPLLSAVVNLDPHAAVGGGDITIVDGAALVADQGPAGAGVEIYTRPTNSQISVYTVRPGDTLSEIAKMFDVTTNTIIGANDIKGGIVHPGETLIILPISGIQYTVAKGDTLASLAKKYNSDVSDIAKYNDLADNATLTSGQTLIIPKGEVSVQPATKTTAKTSTKTATTKSKTAANPYRGGGGPAVGGYYVWPVGGGILTQGIHGWNGVDIGAPKGTAIYASAPGTVLIAKANGGWNGGYGNYVVIAHDNGTQTLYAHMSEVLTEQGASVSQGQPIGKVGRTGEATGNHLHFEVRGASNPFASLSVGISI
jgi:LysM repeat protein